MTAFQTLETRPKVQKIQGYFATIAVGQGTLRLELVPALRKDGLSSRQIAARFPGMTTLNDQWIPILNDMTPMIGTMSDSVDNYEAVSALPSFTLFPWFFVAPGLLLAALALGAGRRRSAT
jgi:disulfide bond formation protein DsbB